MQQLLVTAKFGWWKADFGKKQYICSEYIIKILGLDSEILTFEHFQALIREDYRDRISEEFVSIKSEQVYEQTFPLITPYGELWIHSQLGKKETDEEGNLIAWGYLQGVSDPERIKAEKALEKFNAHLHQQNNISRSLTYFLQTEDTNKVVYKILQNILDQYKAGRAYIIEYDLENNTQNYSFEVTAPGISNQQALIDHIPLEATPWWTRQITSRLPIVLSNLDELPAEAYLEKEMLSLQEIKSLMVIPMLTQDRVWGYMGIDVVGQYREWNYEDYQWFSSLGNIISICLKLHKSKNQILKEREYFKSIYKVMPIGYIRLKLLYTPEGKIYDYRFTDINPAFETITGVKIADCIGHTARELQFTENMNADLAGLEKTPPAPSFRQVNFKSTSKDQYYRCILYSPEPHEVVVLFSDITEILTAHEALNRSEKELRNIYKNIPVGIEIYDKDGFLRDINRKDMEIFGFKDKTDALGVNLFDNPNIPQSIKQQIFAKENVDFEIKFDFTKVGNYYRSEQKGVKELIVKVSPLYDSENKLENYMLIIIDNTETSTAYKKIQDFENFFSIIADFAKVGYFKWNVCKKTGFALNQWFKNWGEAEDSNLEDVIGHYRMLHPDDRPKILNLYQQLLNGQIKGSKEEVRIRDGEKGWKWIRSTVVVNKYNAEQQDIEFIGVNFDITELKEIEAKLIEAKNKAETLDKLKSAFLANMSHEIRTPLNAIVGFSNLLADTDDPDEQKQYLSIIQENNDLLIQLISDILDLSKIEAGTFEIVYGDVDINVLCLEIIRSLSFKTAPGVKLELEHYEPSCHIWGDRNRLMQLIINFINNAIKFTSEGYIRLGYHRIGQEIKFYVKDSGMGIPKEKLPSIFERFVKLNSFIHGTGLGLSICKSIVEQMGGRIGVESEEGKGSCFWFILPFIQADAGQTSTTAATITDTSAVPGQKPRVLVAEDTESNFILISTILKKEYTLLWAHNGKEAIQLYQKEHPDIILMDMRMPEMNGLEATRNIRSKDPKIPIIALTAFAFDSDRSKTLEAGCNDYLSKPVQAQQLKDSIRKLLNAPR